MSKLYIRWMIRRDLIDVLSIEKDSFEFNWSEDDFVRCLRQRNCIGMVADLDDKIAGYMIYELYKHRLHVLNFAVHPDYRRKKIGQTMIEKLQNKLSDARRKRILLEVREKNLPAQLFFKSLGFRAISTLHGYYEDTTEDAYLMEYRVKTENSEFPTVNRISGLLSNEI